MNKLSSFFKRIFPLLTPVAFVFVLFFVFYFTIWQQLSPILSAASIFITSEDNDSTAGNVEFPSVFDGTIDYSDLPYIVPEVDVEAGTQPVPPENDTQSPSGGESDGGQTGGQGDGETQEPSKGDNQNGTQSKPDSGSGSGSSSSSQGYKQELAQVTYPATYILSKDVTYPKYNQHYAVVDIYGREVKVYFGDDGKVLQKGAGQSMGSMPPGFGRPILLGGHNNSYFKKLKNFIIGDVITVKTNYGVYYYQVTETKIANRDDYGATHLDLKREQLVLYTCYPFTTLRLTKYRYFVYAEKIAGPTVVDSLDQIPSSALEE